jgi:hypothetical protein
VGEVGSYPRHVASRLAHDAIRRTSPLQLDDDQGVRRGVPAQEVQAANGRRELMAGLAILRFPELERAAPVDTFPIAEQEVFNEGLEGELEARGLCILRILLRLIDLGLIDCRTFNGLSDPSRFLVKSGSRLASE